jgi:hypothetical protein
LPMYSVLSTFTVLTGNNISKGTCELVNGIFTTEQR